jgi:AraC-like DNA-binding protein
LHFSLINGDSLPLSDGLPNNFAGPLLKGATSTHISGSFGYLAVQEYNTGPLSLRSVFIKWVEAERLICHHEYPPVLFCRIMLEKCIYEVYKGAGKTFLEEEQFSLLTGKEWTSVIISEKPGQHHFVDLAWSAEILNGAWRNVSFFNNPAQSFCDGLPERISGAPIDMSREIKRNVKELLDMDPNDSAFKLRFSEIMLKQLKCVLSEVKDQPALKKEIGETNWHRINEAKMLIEDNLDKKLSTPQLSRRTGVNEFKLKNLFRKMTGFSIDEYRKHLVFATAGRKIVQLPDTPLKIISAEAGYPSVTNFIRAFRVLCHCTPGELREPHWDLSKLFADSMLDFKSLTR